jgi:hypothetical protein
MVLCCSAFCGTSWLTSIDQKAAQALVLFMTLRHKVQ